MVGIKKKTAIILGVFVFVIVGVCLGIRVLKTDDTDTYQLEDEKLKNTLAGFLAEFVEYPVLEAFDQSNTNSILEYVSWHIILDEKKDVLKYDNNGVIWYKIPEDIFNEYLYARFDVPKNIDIILPRSKGYIFVEDRILPKKSYKIKLTDVKIIGDNLYYVTGCNSEVGDSSYIVEHTSDSLRESVFLSEFVAQVRNYGTETNPDLRLLEWKNSRK